MVAMKISKWSLFISVGQRGGGEKLASVHGLNIESTISFPMDGHVGMR
jgi:hypothetical protein